MTAPVDATASIAAARWLCPLRSWASFVSRAHTDHVTVARYLGVVVEEELPTDKARRA